MLSMPGSDDEVAANDQPVAANDHPVAGIKAPKGFSTEGNVSANWKLFKQKWTNYSIVVGMSKRSAEFQRASFLNALTDDALRVYNGFKFENDEDNRTVADIIKAFDDYAVGETNVTYERFVFHKRKQGDSESVDNFISALRELVKTCDFCEKCVSSIVRDQIVLGVNSTDLQDQLLKVQNISLNDCVTQCKVHENATSQSKEFRAESEAVHKVSSNSKGARPKQRFKDKKVSKSSSSFSKDKEDSQSVRDCKFCTSRHVMQRELCPAYNKVCSKCKGRGHFAAKCKASKRRVNAIAMGLDPESSDSDCDFESVDSVSMMDVCSVRNNNLIKAEMLVKDKSVVFQLDSRASVNLINVKHVDKQKIKPSTKTLVMWNGSKMSPLGESRVKVINPKNGDKFAVNFVVVKENLNPLLGASAIQKMRLITVNKENFEMVAKVNEEVAKPGDFVQEFHDVFQDELGSMPGVVNLKVDKTVTPSVAATRRVPVALKPRLKAELRDLVEKNIIEPVSKPTSWVSALALVVKPNGKLRICIDPRPLNKALKREHFQMPVLDDVLPDLAEAKVFTTLDLRNGFWHLKLDEESSDLTTFVTPYGRYRWKVLPFGLSTSPEIFQRHVFENVCDLDGVVNVADDLLVYGKGATEEEAIADHDRKLQMLLQRCRERKIRLNPEKLKLRQKSLSFLGHQITSDGLRPDPAKVQAIQEFERPQDVQAVQRLVGFVNYLAKFLPKISDVMAPIRNLTRKGVPWNWSEAQEMAFVNIKKLVSDAPVLRFYDDKKPLVIQCDASEYGLGAALLQEDQPLAYISRALTDTETRYAQIEKELLAIVYSCERFHQYTFGNNVTVLSDHRPLESIMKKDLVKCPKRLQNMLMRLQKYNVVIKYFPGKKMYLADTLSRAFAKDVSSGELVDVREVDYVPIKEHRLSELREATKHDEDMAMLRKVILEGWPDDKTTLDESVRPYFQFRHEMTVQDGLIFRGNRVVVPKSQRTVLKERLHSSHLGAEGCCRRARECLYWPGMNSDIKDLVAKCSVCRMYEKSNPAEPLMSQEIPERPWAKIGVDLFKSDVDGKEYLCTVDYYSNFWEIDFLKPTTSDAVIKKLKYHFARYGIPDQVVSDNGPQFSSVEFLKFAKKWSFVHTPTSPYNSKGNGKAESAVKMAKNLLRKAAVDRSDPFLAMLDHRNTPTEGHLSPAQKFMARRTKTLLPTTEQLLRPEVPSHAKELNKKKQERQENHFNKRVKTLKPLVRGDVVRVKPFVNNGKVWKKAVVVEPLDARSYTINLNGNLLRRNRVDLKKSAEAPPSPRSPVTCAPVPVAPVPRVDPAGPADNPQNPAVPISTPLSPASTPLSPASTPRPKSSAPRSPVKTTRSGRTVKTPKKFKDFSK